MPAPPTLPCEPLWTDVERVACLFPPVADTRGPCADPDGEPVPATYAWTPEEIVRIASRILFLKTCRRYPGECVVELRPCDPCRACRPGCCECRYTYIPLAGPYPVIDVAEVKINGVTLDPSAYRVDEYLRLVRIDGEGGWPRQQNLNENPDDPNTETFVIRYVTGREVPEDLQYAATLLAGELNRACNGQTCGLPDRVTSVVRDGVSFDLVDPAEIAAGSTFGVPMIDAILKQYPCDDARRYRFTSRLMHPLMDGERYDRSGVRG